MLANPWGAQPGTKAQADTELPGGAKSLTTSHNYANPPKRECSTSLHVIQGYPRTGDSCPCTGLFAGTVVGALDEWPERRLRASAGDANYREECGLGAQRRHFAIHLGTLALKRGAFDCARRERYSLVLRRSHRVTIFVGSTASLSICISTTLPLLSTR